MIPILYWFAYYLIKFLSFFFFPLRVVGRENIPRQAHFLYASNHLSNLDPILLGLAVPFRISYMAKDSLFKNRILGWVLRNVSNAFPLKREKADIGALKEAIRRLKHNSPVVVFPQGTRTLDEKAQTPDNAQEGIGFLVAKSGVPVLPAKIIGSDKVMPPHSKFPKRHLITIIIGKPLYFTGKEPYDQIAREVMKSIFAL